MQAVPPGFTEAVADDPRGPLDLRGDDLCLQLMVRGATGALVWMYDGGSTGRYFAWTHPLDEAARLVEALERTADDPRPDRAAAWLACLCPGRYALAWSDPGDAPDIHRGPSPGSLSWYGDECRIVETQARIDPARVDAWADRIAGGARPTIVTLGLDEHMDRFLLDGHHRRRAYHRLGVAAPELRIVRLDAPPVDRGDARAMLREVQRDGSDRQLTDWTIRDFLAK
jgi:hypothetical protein